MTTRNALIVGASGLTGGYCLRSLLDESRYDQVIAPSRTSLELDHPRLNQVITDFEHPEEPLGSLQADDVFCCLGTTIKKAGSQADFKKVDFYLVLKIAELMRQQGARQFLVISAMGADRNSKLFYNRVKGKMEEALQGLHYPHLHIIRPSLLLGPRREFRLGEKIATRLGQIVEPLLLNGLAKYKPIEAEKVGRFMVQAAHVSNAAAVNIYESDQIESLT